LQLSVRGSHWRGCIKVSFCGGCGFSVFFNSVPADLCGVILEWLQASSSVLRLFGYYMLCGNAVCGHVQVAVEWPYEGFLAAAVGRVVLYLTPVDRNGAAASRIKVFWSK